MNLSIFVFSWSLVRVLHKSVYRLSLSGSSITLCLLGSLLFVLLVLAEGLGEGSLELLVGDLLLGLDKLGLVPHWGCADERGTARQESNGEVESSDKGVGGGIYDLVGLDKRVLNSLLQTHTRSLLVLQDADVEGERSSLLLDLREDSTGVLHFELVGDSGITLVDGRPGVFDAGLEVSGGNVMLVCGTMWEGQDTALTLPSSLEETRMSIP